ncbi:putative transposase YncI [Bacteroidia bacterium]|nr:putative transposase YncI [Bacteroidia bacterium]
MQTPISYFTELTDPRVDRSKEHLMEDILFITLAAVICGAESWNDIENYGKSKESWLKQYLHLPNGIPSHDTFNRFFSALDPNEFEQAFLSWIKDISELTEGDIISIDGKTLCGSREGGSKRAVHIVSAWSKANQLSLGQVKVDAKSNEITAIPKLLEVLVLKGCLVTIDAMGCQRDIAGKIIEKEADYLLAVKGNQGCLEEDAERTVRFTKPASEWVEEDFGHGRIEQRKCTLYNDLSFIDHAAAWKNLTAIVKIEATRYIKSSGKEEKEIRLYITSSKEDAEVIGRGVRSHWGIENNLHWQLDVSFNEDDSRKREGYAAQNFSTLNRIALNLIKHEQSKKRSVKGKRLDAGWNNDYLLKILMN